ncbi:MAG TPA: TonB-dependent receptor [Rhizomicrobium sp.]|nr:TonB-dependent receptor [Rhizomicrobium sp.]
MRIQGWLLSAAAISALTLAQTNVVMAQQVTASLRGHLTGGDGSLVSGATVHLINTRTGATLDTVTGDSGSFSLTGLNIGGPYTLKIEAPGYSEKTLTGIYLSVGETSNVEVAMQALDVETVVVAGTRGGAASSIVETRGVATTFDAHDIKVTPSLERDLKDIVQRSPYAFVDPVGGGSSPPVATLNIAGANPRCTNLLVDGMQQKDNFGLNLGGYPTQRAPIPTDWADQIQVAPIPYDVEYNDTCGAVINVVTKQGDNDFHGTAYGYYEDRSMNGDKIANVTSIPGTAQKRPFVQPLKPPYNEKSYGGTLSGPIIEDHLFFFIGYDELKQEQSASALGGTGAAGSGFTKTASHISLSDVEEVETIAKQVYGYNSGDLTDSVPLYNQRYIAKLTWQINDDQRLTGTYQHVSGGQLAIVGGSTTPFNETVSLPSHWYNNEEKMEAYSLQYLANWSDNFSTQIYAGHVGINDIQAPLHGTNFPEVYVRTVGNNGVYDLGTATQSVTVGDPALNSATVHNSDDGYVILGPDFSRQYNFLFYKNNFAKGVGDYVLDNHTFKFGVEYHDIGIVDKFIQGAQSIVRFDSIADFANQKIAQTLDNRFSATSTSAQGGNPVYYANGIGGVSSVGDANFHFQIGSLFAQDEWYATKDLSFEFGLRYDAYFSDDHPVLNGNFQKRYGFSNTRNLDGLSALMPRISGSYEFGFDSDSDPGTTMRLRAGLGKFSGGFQTVWATNSYDTTGVQTLSTFGIPGFANGVPVAPGTPCSTAAPYACVPDTLPTDHQQWLDDLNNGPLAQASTVKNSTVNAILPNFKLPYTWKANIGSDIVFGPGMLGDSWIATIDLFSTRDYAQPYWTNLRVMPSGATAPDGRILYQWRFDTSGTNNRPDPAGGGTTITGTDIGMGSANGGGSTVIVLDAKSRWDNTGWGDFGLELGYTHTKATDISAATSSTANSNYTNQAHVNYNQAETGTSDYERVHRFTLNFDATEHWFGDTDSNSDWATKLNIFGQRMSGEHYSFTFANNPFGPTGVGVTGRSLIYVPVANSFGNVTATSDPLVTYAPGFNVAAFNQMLHQTGLINYAGRIAPRNGFTGRWDTLVNLGLEQDIPSYTDYGHLSLTVDCFNFLNLLNHNWGAFQSPNFYQAFAASTATIVNGKYNFTAFQTAAQLQNNFSTQRTASTYQLEVGLHYEF